MTMLVFKKETLIPCPALELFRWHESPDAFSKLIPPGEPVRVLHHDGHIRNGARAVVLVGRWPCRFRWELVHCDYIEGEQFCDVQVSGPFHSYKHVHRMIEAGTDTCVLSDCITFTMPLGALGRLIGRFVILRRFGKLFDYRHNVTLEALTRAA